MLQAEDRVAEPTGHAATVVGPTNAIGDVLVQRDADGESRPYAEDSLTKLATRERRVETRGGVVQPRAWTMGGGVD